MLLSLQDASKKIERGLRLVIAGDEALLSKLPKGDWIGGTIPYFMAHDGGKVTKDQLFVHDLTGCTQGAAIKYYGHEDLPNIAKDAPEQGFSVLVVPGFSAVHHEYAENAPNYEDIFMKPILGWVSGIHLSDLGKVSPKVFNGADGTCSDNKAVAIHFQIEKGKTAIVNILNVFKQGSGDTLTFEEEGFVVKNCLVNGVKQDFADYIKNNNIDTKLPLVADYSGAKVNVSYQGLREADGAVMMYAPVFQGVEYKFAEPVPDYVAAFQSIVPKEATPVFACNCILNFLYSELEGKVIENMYGPITFGEVAYQLVNQTLVYLEVK